MSQLRPASNKEARIFTELLLDEELKYPVIRYTFKQNYVFNNKSGRSIKELKGLYIGPVIIKNGKKVPHGFGSWINVDWSIICGIKRFRGTWSSGFPEEGHALIQFSPIQYYKGQVKRKMYGDDITLRHLLVPLGHGIIIAETFFKDKILFEGDFVQPEIIDKKCYMKCC